MLVVKFQVQKITCSDLDSGTVLDYSILSGNTDDDFSINQNGEIITDHGMASPDSTDSESTYIL